MPPVRHLRSSVVWSGLSGSLLRAGSLILGLVLARLLTPEQFGVYAIALTVQTVLITIADLGFSADLVRASDPARRAPTAAGLGLIAGGLVSALMAATAIPVASFLGSPASAGVIAVLSLTVFLAGAGVVPYALLNRSFRQRSLFCIAVADFVIGTTVTVTLILLGWGVMSLAIGRVCAQVVTLGLQFRSAGVRPTYRIDRSVARSVLSFGVPVAGANLLSWVLLSTDNVIIARVAGPLTLGFYVLAFNVSSWPMTVIGQVVRSVALPVFARARDEGGQAPALVVGLAVSWAAGLPAGALLAALAGSVIRLLYGSAWQPAAPALVALGTFGALRVAFDLLASYLLGHGQSRKVLLIQVLWMVALLPSLYLATSQYGIVGAAWVHVVVALLVILPAYLVALHRSARRTASLIRVLSVPLAAAVPAAVAARMVADRAPAGWLALVAGLLVGVVLYAAPIVPWARRELRRAAFWSHEVQAGTTQAGLYLAQAGPTAAVVLRRQSAAELHVGELS